MRRAARVALLAFAVMVTAPARSRADGKVAATTQATAQAATLKTRADSLVLAGRPVDALPLYTEAYTLTRDPAILYNRARAYESLARWTEALDDFRAFDREATAEVRGRLPDFQKLVDGVEHHIATLRIVCNENDAVVQLDGTRVGRSPLTEDIRRNEGHVHIEVMKEGFLADAKDLEVPGGGLSRIEMRLQAKPTTGRLLVSSPVRGAIVSIDGAPVGNAPAESVLRAGNHRVVVAREGYDAAEADITLAPSEEKRLTLTPKERTSVLGSWWFWTAAGVLAAGGVTIAIVAATREESPRSGTLVGGQVQTFRFGF